MGDSEMDMDEMYGDENMDGMAYGNEYGDEMGEGRMMEMGEYDGEEEESMNFDENPEYAHMP